MSKGCRYRKPDGTECQHTASDGNGFCWWHSPDHADRRRVLASRGGRGRSSRTKEAKEIRVELRRLADAVVRGELEREKGTAAGQLLNYALRSLQVERDLLETEELEARVAEMEQDMGRGA